MISIDGKRITSTMFPDHTSQVWKLDSNIGQRHAVNIEWSFEHEGEFLQLAQLKHLLTEMGVISYLYIPYLPYGRQDKDVDNEMTFALRTFAELLNSLRFTQVTITDPHSQVALDMIKNSVAIYPVAEVLSITAQTHSDLVCYPDEGALKKYSVVYPSFIPNDPNPYIHGEKIRDPRTGNITSYKLIGDPTGKTVLIVDDICDGGATFKLLTKELYSKGAKDVHLFVTHGIFSKGTQTLFNCGISRMFTMNGEVAKETLAKNLKGDQNETSSHVTV